MRWKKRSSYGVDGLRIECIVFRSSIVATHGRKPILRRAMKKSRGNIGRCAKICGLSRRSISAKLSEYKINKEEFKVDA